MSEIHKALQKTLTPGSFHTRTSVPGLRAYTHTHTGLAAQSPSNNKHEAVVVVVATIVVVVLVATTTTIVLVSNLDSSVQLWATHVEKYAPKGACGEQLPYFSL